MWIKEKLSREYHVVCNGKTNRPSEKGLLLDEVEHDMMNYQNQGLCYLLMLKAEHWPKWFYLVVPPGSSPSNNHSEFLHLFLLFSWCF